MTLLDQVITKMIAYRKQNGYTKDVYLALSAYLQNQTPRQWQKMLDTLGLCEVAEYYCKDSECKGTETRDAKTLQEAGDPYCPICDCEMQDYDPNK